MSESRFWRLVRRRGFRVPSYVALIVVSVWPLTAIWAQPPASWATILIVIGSGMFAASFHYTSTANSAYSVAIPMNDAEMYAKAHEMSVGSGIMAVAAGMHALIGVAANFFGEDKDINVLWRVAFTLAMLLTFVLFWRGYEHVRRQIPWGVVTPPADPAALPRKPDPPARPVLRYAMLSFLVGLLASTLLKRQK